MTLYDKDEAADLTPAEKRALKAAIAMELKAREVKRTAQEKKARRVR